MNNFGDYMRMFRARYRLSTTELSKITGVSQPYLSQIENGTKNPSKKILYKIAEGIAVEKRKEVSTVYRNLLEAAGYIPPEEVETIAPNEPNRIFVDEENNSYIEVYKGDKKLNSADTEVLRAMIKGFLYDKKFD